MFVQNKIKQPSNRHLLFQLSNIKRALIQNNTQCCVQQQKKVQHNASNASQLHIFHLSVSHQSLAALKRNKVITNTVYILFRVL